MAELEKQSDPRKIQINLTGFLERNTGAFMSELWKLLISAQENYLPGQKGMPTQLLKEKEEEINRINQELQERARKISEDQQRFKERGKEKEEHADRQREVSCPCVECSSSLKSYLRHALSSCYDQGDGPTE